MNKVIAMGRIANDPELKSTTSGIPVLSFRIACRRSRGNETDFFECTAWRNTGEFINKYFKKGDMITIIGNGQNRSWEGKDGQKITAYSIVIEEAHFTGNKVSNKESFESLSDEEPLPF